MVKDNYNNSDFQAAIEDPSDCPYYLISRVTLVVTSALKKGFSDAGIDAVKPAYLGVLIALWRADGVKVIELGRLAGLEPSTMTGLLDRMERDGLAYRAADPNDRRVLLIYLTDSGRNVQKTVLKVLNKVLSNVFSGISFQEVSQVMNLMRQVLVNANEGRK